MFGLHTVRFAPWVALWYSGPIFTMLNMLLLSWAWLGTKRVYDKRFLLAIVDLSYSLPKEGELADISPQISPSKSPAASVQVKKAGYSI